MWLALNVGHVDVDIETASLVLGFRSARAGLLLVPKVPNPAIRTSSPLVKCVPDGGEHTVYRLPGR